MIDLEIQSLYVDTGLAALEVAGQLWLNVRLIVNVESDLANWMTAVAKSIGPTNVRSSRA
jgi:hypothetical protein